MNNIPPSQEGQPSPESKTNQPTAKLVDLLNGLYSLGDELDNVGRDIYSSTSDNVLPGEYVHRDFGAGETFLSTERVLLRQPANVISIAHGYKSEHQGWGHANFHVVRPVHILDTGGVDVISLGTEGYEGQEQLFETDSFIEIRPDKFVVFIEKPRAAGRIPEQPTGATDEAYYVYSDADGVYRIVNLEGKIEQLSSGASLDAVLFDLSVHLHVATAEEQADDAFIRLVQVASEQVAQERLAEDLITVLTGEVTLTPFTTES